MTTFENAVRIPQMETLSLNKKHDHTLPYQCSATDLVSLLERQETSVDKIVHSCLTRIAERESLIKAWAWIDANQVKRQLRNSPESVRTLPLYGVPIGVKDIIDTADMPTAYGSKLYDGHRPDADAVLVSRLRAAGAIIIGKTVTTEFAYTHPGPTVNPHNLTHTPGGSSSGSAAAVADSMVPIAIGTQTGGSTIRPSAYCGIVGFKPTLASVPMNGVRPLAPSMDTIGIHARCVADVALVYPVLHGHRAPRIDKKREAIRVGFYPGPHADQADADARDALGLAKNTLISSGMVAIPISLPDRDFGDLGEASRTIMAYEAAQGCADDYSRGQALMGASTRDLIETGQRIDAASYQRARALVTTCRKVFSAAMQDFDMLMTFSAPGEAPLLSAGTGSSTFNRAWTAIGAPCLTLPFVRGASGVLPLGIQFVAGCGNDAGLLAAGMLLESTFDRFTD